MAAATTNVKTGCRSVGKHAKRGVLLFSLLAHAGRWQMQELQGRRRGTAGAGSAPARVCHLGSLARIQNPHAKLLSVHSILAQELVANDVATGIPLISRQRRSRRRTSNCKLGSVPISAVGLHWRWLKVPMYMWTRQAPRVLKTAVKGGHQHMRDDEGCSTVQCTPRRCACSKSTATSVTRKFDIRTPQCVVSLPRLLRVRLWTLDERKVHGEHGGPAIIKPPGRTRVALSMAMEQPCSTRMSNTGSTATSNDPPAYPQPANTVHTAPLLTNNFAIVRDRVSRPC